VTLVWRRAEDTPERRRLARRHVGGEWYRNPYTGQWYRDNGCGLSPSRPPNFAEQVEEPRLHDAVGPEG
jgi:hypothetical protein